MHKSLIPVLAFFICLFIFPSDCAAGAKDGLLLWFNTMIPSVFPFILITNILHRLGGIRLFARIFGKPVKKLFGCSAGGAYAVIVGLLCGYPMGAKAVTDSLQTGDITIGEARYLLCFVNNPSPMFLINFVLAACLGKPSKIGLFFTIVYFSTWLNARLWYILKYKKLIKDASHSPADAARITSYASRTADTNFLMTSVELMQKMGVYMIIFAIICRLIFKLPTDSLFFTTPLFKSILAGLAEQTTGLAALGSLTLPAAYEAAKIKIILAAIFTCFGGFAAAAQTYGIIRGHGLSLKTYICGKTAHSAIAGLTAVFFVYFL